MMNALGAHIYAGGFTLGVAKHFNVLAHLEHDGYGSDVIRLNFPGLPIYSGGPGKWPDFQHEKPRFIYANPPCAIWSGANTSSKAHTWHLDPRLQAHHDIFNYAMDIVAPDVLAIESVPPSFTKGRAHIDELIAKAETYGYATTCVLHNAQWLGIPQSRQRVFYVFHKVAIPWETPDFSQPVTVRQAFKGLPRGKRGYAIPVPPRSHLLQLPYALPGESLNRVFAARNPDPPRGARGQRIDSPPFLSRRLPWDRPAPVPLLVYHPEKNRCLTQDELATICSYPLDYKWPKSSNYAAVAGYMNRAVMPKVGEWLAAQIYSGLMKNNRLNDLTPVVFDIVKPPGNFYDLQPQGELPMARAAQPAYPLREGSEGSGAYIRRLLTDWSDDTDAVLEAVHAQFEGSRAKASDISWNRGILKKENGEAPAPASRAAKKAAAAPPPVAKRGPGRPRKEAAA
jgi:site-specific DNA-cytosine methylase